MDAKLFATTAQFTNREAGVYNIVYNELHMFQFHWRIRGGRQLCASHPRAPNSFIFM